MKRFLLPLFFLLALSLRILWLDKLPSGFTPDEASFGYDAYSIMNTGNDQWGNNFPIILKSFGDGKMPLYAYLSIPSVAAFGLNKSAVRFPNAFFGSLAVLIVYFLVIEFLKDKKIALLSAFLLAVSPWHIPMSRGAFEANLTTFLMPLGILFFLKGFKKSKNFTFSAIIFGINLFSYHSARLITPLIFAFLVWQHRENINKLKPALITFALFFALACFTYFQGAGSRLGSASIINLASQAGPDRYNAVQIGETDFIARVFNNKLTKLISIFTGNYFSYYSPQFFFTQGPAEGTYGMIPGRGVLYLIELLFIAGFLLSLYERKNKIPSWLVVWLLLSPIPASLSIGPGYAANRAAIMMPAIQIASSIGAWFIYSKIKFKKIATITLSFLFLISFVFFLDDYLFQEPQRAKDMVYGGLEVSEYLSSVEQDYDQIIISKSISEPHIYIAFAKKMSPKLYQQEVNNWRFDESGLTWVDQLPNYNLGKYTFKSINWKLDQQIPNSLLVGTKEEFSEDTVPQQVIYYPNNKEAFWIVKTKALVYAEK